MIYSLFTYLYTVLNIYNFTAVEMGGWGGGDTEELFLPRLFPPRPHPTFMNGDQFGCFGKSASVWIVGHILQKTKKNQNYSLKSLKKIKFYIFQNWKKKLKIKYKVQ